MKLAEARPMAFNGLYRDRDSSVSCPGPIGASVADYSLRLVGFDGRVVGQLAISVAISVNSGPMRPPSVGAQGMVRVPCMLG